MAATIHFHDVRNVAQRFDTGVSLHSHTCFSKETLGFVYRYAREVSLLGWAVKRGERQYLASKGAELDLAKAYWTPPIAPLEAMELEAAQICSYDLEPLVSLTDHDTIEAPLWLHSEAKMHDFPLSVEWTVPYRQTFFHLGIHNLPKNRASQFMREFASFTQRPKRNVLPELIAAIAENPGTLIVFNHPCWDEKNIGKDLHRAAAMEFLATCGDWLDALELNGLRPWKENREVIELSEAIGKPLISGGDRHGLKANTIVNFTRAKSFSEFTSEIRAGYSEVALLPTYGQAFQLRLLRDLQDILSHRPGHGLGWSHWEQRVFFECHDREVRSLADIFKYNTPFPVPLFVQTVLGLQKPICTGVLKSLWGRDETIATGAGLGEPEPQFRRPAAERVS